MLITEVDERPAPDLDSFISVVKDKKDKDSLQLKVMNLKGRTKVITLQLNNNYWPMAQIIDTEKGWVRSEF